MKIVCFGDSLTRGVSYVKGRIRILKENYPLLLQQFFSSDDSYTVSVVNKGVFNDDSDLLIQRLNKDVILEKPDYIILEIGGNDCNFKWEEVAAHPENEHTAIVPIDRYIDNVKAIVNNLIEAGITPVVLTLPPLDPVRYYKFISEKYGKSISHWISAVGGIEHWHSLYNRSLKQLTEQLDVITIDVRTALKQAGDFSKLISDDGIHLTADGYKELAKTIYSQINSLTGLHPQHC